MVDIVMPNHPERASSSIRRKKQKLPPSGGNCLRYSHHLTTLNPLLWQILHISKSLYLVVSPCETIYFVSIQISHLIYYPSSFIPAMRIFYSTKQWMSSSVTLFRTFISFKVPTIRTFLFMDILTLWVLLKITQTCWNG